MKKNEIRKKIIENLYNKERDPHNNLDRLEFLIDPNDEQGIYFELNEPITLKNSWKKKAGGYLIVGAVAGFMIYTVIQNFDLHKWVAWFLLFLFVVLAISYIYQFLENKVILDISAKGLNIEKSIFNKWEDIEFLYFKTKYDGEGRHDGIYLVELLKTGVEHEVLISNLPWSADQLGTTLYQCMKRYSK